MPSIVSLYSDPVVANVFSDVLPPEPVVLTTITGIQDTNAGAIPQGRTKITLNWTLPATNERIGGEHLGTATGAAQDLETLFDPVTSGSYTVYEETGYTGGGGASTLAAQANIGDKVLQMGAVTGFGADDWVRLEESGDDEYVQIDNVDGNNLNLKTAIRFKNWPVTVTTVKEVDVTAKTETTDYTITLASGEVSLVAGQFTVSNEVFINYKTDLQDLDHLEIYRIPGNLPVAHGGTYAAVTGHGQVETVDNAVSSTATSYEDVLTIGYNGETWSYYVFCLDDESTPNKSYTSAIMVETLVTIPQNPRKTVGDAQVIMEWDSVSDTNVDGLNVYRCDGGTFTPSTAKKVNSSIITGTTFDDSAGNTTNRVDPGVVPYPVNGNVYTYKVESIDDVTDWDTGTQNQSDGQSEVNTASKTFA